MQKTINKTNFDKLNSALKEAAKKPSFDVCAQIAFEVMTLLGVSEPSKKLFASRKLMATTSKPWVKNAPGFADGRKASYILTSSNIKTIDFKLYWANKTTKFVIYNLTALTPNFEDEPFYANENIGVDFVVPQEADRLIVTLTKNYVVRTLELHEKLLNTHKEILNKWAQPFEFDNKALTHKVLWDSFDIKPVNKKFYENISRFFIELVQHLTTSNKLSEKEAPQFATRLLGRLIFCWFLNKKGLLSKEQRYLEIQPATDSTEYYRAKLEKLFFRTLNAQAQDRSKDPFSLIGGLDEFTPFLNGGLFDNKASDHFSEKRITFPKDYFQRMYEFLHGYNFTTDESTADFQQVAIDPEMLGRIFENLLAEQLDESKEQARKAKGAFYTPREIVHYMCTESLRAHLSVSIKDEREKEKVIGLLFDKKDHEWDIKNYAVDLKSLKRALLDALDNVKVLDPAVGSGAFPMGMLQIMLKLYERLNPRLDYYKTKLGIIKNNLYGVDIEPMAIEIARLRAWLSLIVDEKITEKEDNSGIKTLPNFDFKFMCANSLIGLPQDAKAQQDFLIMEDPFFDSLERSVSEYFSVSNPEAKQKWKKEIKRLIENKVEEKQKIVLSASTTLNIGNSKHEYNEVVKARKKKAISHHSSEMNLWNSYTNIFTAESPVGFFDPQYFFPDVKRGKFDIVIANPPYVEHKKLKEISPILKSQYSIYSGTADLYVYFVEKGLSLLKKNGSLAFITSNKFMKTSYGENLRALLASKKLSQVIDFTNVHVFHALVASCIFIVGNQKPEENILVSLANDDLEDFSELRQFIKSNHFMVESKILNEQIWQLENIDVLGLKRKIEINTKMIREFSSIKVCRGITTGYNEAFVVDTAIKDKLLKSSKNCKDVIKPLLQGRDIRKWTHKTSGTFILQTGYDVNIEKQYPEIYKHLLKFNDKLKIRSDQGKAWWNLRACIYYPEFEKEKIIWGLTADKWAFAYDDKGNYLPSNGYILTSTDIPIKYLLALLNSNLMKFYFRFIGIMTAGGAFTLKHETIQELPIKELSQKAQKPFIDLVDKILIAKKQDPKADTSKWETLIDQMVYKLYNLTEEEIHIVEQKEQQVKKN